MKAKLITAAALSLATLGFIASTQTAPEASSASRRSESVRPAPNGSAEPVETPLVAKVLKPEPTGPKDGDLTADGFFRFDASRRIWAPVDMGNPRYLHNKGRVGLEHLIAEHGHAFSSASMWTQEELEIAHANSHAWEASHASTRSANVSPKVVYSTKSSGCPDGVNCGNPKVGRGLFGRR